MKLNNDLKIIYAIALFEAIVLILGPGPKFIDDCDTPSYIDAWDSFTNGTIDLLRTPVYPAFLGLLKNILGQPLYMWIAILIQHFIFFLSIGILYKLIRLFAGSSRIAFWITLFYSSYPGFTFTNNWGLTQSFALSGCVFIIYLTLLLCKQPTIWRGGLFTFMLLFLLFLRPGLVYFLPVFFLSWVLYLFKNKRTGVIGLVGVVIAALTVFFYMKAFERQYGLFTFTGITVKNQFTIARDAGFFDSSSDLVRDYDKTYEEIYPKEHNWSMVDKVYYSKHKITDVYDSINNAFRKDPIRWVAFCYDRLYRSAQEPLSGLCQIKYKEKKLDIVGPMVNTIYLFVFFYSILLIYWIIKRKMVPWLSLLLCMLIICNTITTIVGAPYGSYILPVTPFYLMLIAQVLSCMKFKPLKNIEMV